MEIDCCIGKLITLPLAQTPQRIPRNYVQSEPAFDLAFKVTNDSRVDATPF